MHKSLSILLLVLVFVHGCSESGPALSISQLQVVAPAPGRTPSVAYFSINNHGGTYFELIGVSSSQFVRVELHQTLLHDGVARMQALASVIINANSSVAFSPGGRHVMLFEPTQGLVPGADVSLQFQFASGEILMLTSPLKTRIAVD